ncbi:MAG TPA: right-handed parallel beta-helix repeat-containing protein [Cytophagaceae bacterium]
MNLLMKYWYKSFLTGILFLVFAQVAVSAIYTVDNTGDADDGFAYTVGDGTNTLRKCLRLANASVGIPDIINFNLGAGGPFTITIGSTLVISDPVTINGSLSATDKLEIGINGNNTANPIIRITETGGGSTLYALAIYRSAGWGIFINNSDNNVIRRCHIGTDVYGLTNLGNAWHGIEINNSSNNTIGGNGGRQDRNIISGNGQRGIMIVNNATGTKIYGNYIGVDSTGVNRMDNEFGIWVDNGCNNTEIGGNRTMGFGNVISGNLVDGIHIFEADDCVIKGNIIGLGADGTTVVSNGQLGIVAGDGIEIRENALRCTIGSTVSGEGNIISGNLDFGIRMHVNCDDAVIEGNYVGVDITGVLARGNSVSGISAQNGCDNLSINENLVADNRSAGVLLFTSTNSTITNNIIGLNINGDPMGNYWDGIVMDINSNNNTVTGNTLSSNRNNSGIRIGGSSNNTVTNNKIGTDPTGTLNRGNDNYGVFISAPGFAAAGTQAINNIITNNIIAYNRNGGVHVDGVDALYNSIRNNSIFCNGNPSDYSTGQKGIELINGSNEGVLPPTVHPASTLDNIYGTAFPNGTVDLYYSDSTCHSCATGFEQGQYYIGSVVADASGNWSYTAGVTSYKITATVTTPNNSTSEFSDCSTLPVTFLSFDVKKENTGVILTWSTANEENNAYFEILRSEDGINFEPIGQRDGAGNSIDTRFYTFYDPTPIQGTVYYTIKQVDFNGQFTTTAIKSLTNSLSNTFEVIKTSEDGEFLVRFVTGAVDNVRLKVINTPGQTIIDTPIEIKEGINEIFLDLGKYSTGIYHIILSDTTGSFIEKIIK